MWTGPATWPSGSNSGRCPGADGKLMPNDAVLNVRAFWLRSPETVGSSAERVCVTRARAWPTRRRATSDPALCTAARRAAVPRVSGPVTAAGAGAGGWASTRAAPTTGAAAASTAAASASAGRARGGGPARGAATRGARARGGGRAAGPRRGRAGRACPGARRGERGERSLMRWGRRRRPGSGRPPGRLRARPAGGIGRDGGVGAQGQEREGLQLLEHRVGAEVPDHGDGRQRARPPEGVRHEGRRDDAGGDARVDRAELARGDPAGDHPRVQRHRATHHLVEVEGQQVGKPVQLADHQPVDRQEGWPAERRPPGAHVGAQLLGGAAVARVAELEAHLLEAGDDRLADHLAKQLFLVREVEVDGPLGDAGAPGDVVEACPGQPPLAELGEGGVDDLLGALVGRPATGDVGGHAARN
jgi:hypothetical protein